jgi:hypothetical protein
MPSSAAQPHAAESSSGTEGDLGYDDGPCAGATLLAVKGA